MSLNVYFFLSGLAIGAALFCALRAFLTRRAHRTTQHMLREMNKYFKASGVLVNASCQNTGHDKYVALIETEPLKKFRFSFIIEHSLNRHLLNTVGHTLDRVYWRFVIPQITSDEVSTENVAEEAEVQDAQISERVPVRQAEPSTQFEEVTPEEALPLRNSSKTLGTDAYMVDEISWENYQTALKIPNRQQAEVIKNAIATAESKARSEIGAKAKEKARAEIKARIEQAEKAKREARAGARENAETRAKIEQATSDDEAKPKSNESEKAPRALQIKPKPETEYGVVIQAETNVATTVTKDQKIELQPQEQSEPERLASKTGRVFNEPKAALEFVSHDDTERAWTDALRLAREAEQAIATELAVHKVRYETRNENGGNATQGDGNLGYADDFYRLRPAPRDGLEEPSRRYALRR